MNPLAIRHPVPDFSAESTAGRPFRLSERRGRNLVLYFYPKDDTPGCTQEGRDFRDLHPEFRELDTDVVGVSRDSMASHERFQCKHELPFELLSDTDETACNLFGVIALKTLYGKPVRGIQRSTFLIDREGKLVAEWRKVRVNGHAREVLAAVRELAAHGAA
jgi:peroxiredoxin Q/BCP